MEGDEKRKTWFEPEQDIAVWAGRGSQSGLEMMGKTGVRFSDKQIADEGGEPVGAASKTDDLICKMIDEKAEETASECRNQTESDSGGKAERSFKTSCGSRKKREETGWVLVCGQGFQLLRVRNTEMDEAMRTEERRKRLLDW